MSNPSNNSRFVDMGGGYIAEKIASQVQVFYNPTTQQCRAVFSGSPYILMGTTYQRIGDIPAEALSQDLTYIMPLRLVPAGVRDPVTGADLSQISIAGAAIFHKFAYDFFHNVQHGTPGYPLAATINGPGPGGG
jgi:hypothetical protein